jgi:hypothetical protein
MTRGLTVLGDPPEGRTAIHTELGMRRILLLAPGTLHAVTF